MVVRNCVLPILTYGYQVWSTLRCCAVGRWSNDVGSGTEVSGEERVIVGRVPAARSAHGDFADYHEQFGMIIGIELTC